MMLAVKFWVREQPQCGAVFALFSILKTTLDEELAFKLEATDEESQIDYEPVR